MTYKLYRQLWEARFPNLPYFEDTDEDGEITGGPTLSQLITACWRHSHQFRLDYVREKKMWAACTCWGNGFEDDWQDGATPEEATAKLWLELNKPAE